jgi:predicted ATP-dependent endonuclease of OLD family
MLENLSIKNFVIVDHLELNFKSGFSALTGETGAGKSILIGALSLTLGQRGDRRGARWTGALRPRSLEEALLRLDGEHPRLVHLPSEKMGCPYCLFYMS